MENKILFDLFDYLTKENPLNSYSEINIDKKFLEEKMEKAFKKLTPKEQQNIIINFPNKNKRKLLSETLVKLDEIIYEDALESKLTKNIKNYYFNAIESDLGLETDASKNNMILFNKKKKSFQLVYGNLGNWFGGEIKFTKEYKLNAILDLSLIEVNSTVIKNSNNIGKIIASGLLFGPIGVLAGAIDKGGTQRSSSKNSYSLRFSLNDVDLAVVDLKCSSSEIAERVINTIKLIKKTK
jgi:hypothetical protein